MQQSDGSTQTVTGTGPANYRTYSFTVTGTYVYVYAYFGGQYYRLDFNDGATSGAKCANGQVLVRFDGLSPGSTGKVLIYPVNGC